MADSTKVRLVRCPKCENLLQELEGFSVYQCGGCGAVLRAKNKEHEAESVSGKSEEERDEGTSAKSGNSSNKGVVVLSEASESDAQSNADSSRHEEKIPEKQSQVRTEKWVVENDPSMSMNSNELGNSAMDREKKDLNRQSVSRNSGRISDEIREERIRPDGFRRRIDPRNDIEGVRLSISEHPDEGTSNYYSESSYDHRKTLTSGNDCRVEQDRSELLRKLDELKEQLSRSANVADKSKEKVPSSSLGSDRPSMPFFGSGKHVAARPPYYHQYPESFPPHGREIPMHGVLCPLANNSTHIHGYGDPFGFQMHRRAPQQSHPYYSGPCADSHHDLFEPYPQNGILHHPSCSCFHCYGKHRNQRFVDATCNSGLYPHENVGPFDQRIPNPRTFVPPSLSSRGSQAHHTRWQSELMGPDMGCFSRNRAAKVIIGSEVHRTRPLAGGAPFLTCLNCFELLELPKKANLAVKRQQKLRCGACSSVFDLSIIEKKLVISVNAKTTPVSMGEMDDRFHRVIANFSSDDYDNLGYEFHSMDREPVEKCITDQALISNKPQEMHNFPSSSTSISEDENGSDSLNAKLYPQSSPLQDHFNNSSTNHAVRNRFATGNRSARSEQDKVLPNKVATRQNSLKEASVATEMEVSYNEYSNATALSQDSAADRREDDQPKSKKGGDSFFANIVKKSFKDLTKSSHNEERGKTNVSVNGHLISERLVKKAEKLAGPIQPGNYWYDYRAGFWGVMSGPCLGIIPPFIEELNCPMPENCAGGNTGVFVNGRELHEKDLDLLATRGLPTDRDRSYIVDISGRVFDEDSSEELDSLGKLAPTVEKMKHGFGMKVPRVSA